VDLENHLHRNGTRIIKFFLHLSKEEQRKRFLERIDDPGQELEIQLADIEERKFWKQYMKAYEACLSATSTKDAPWYVVPADDKENARLIISEIILDKVNRGRTNQPARRSTGLRFKGTRSLLVIGLSIALMSTAFAGAGGAQADRNSTDANITRLATTLLEHSQFAHHPLDSQLAGIFLDRYLDALDGGRSVFLQSDVDEFGAYRPTLARDTRDQGDTRAARAIFARYLQRLSQRVTYLTDLLATSKFEFSGHDVYSFDREHAARPRDPTAARELWRQQVRAEYLQEKLADKQPGQIVKTLTHRYAQQLATMKALRSDEVLEIYLNALAHVYDPHSDYLGHEQMDSFFHRDESLAVWHRRVPRD
jgi:hypothetical protein